MSLGYEWEKLEEALTQKNTFTSRTFDKLEETRKVFGEYMSRALAIQYTIDSVTIGSPDGNEEEWVFKYWMACPECHLTGNVFVNPHNDMVCLECDSQFAIRKSDKLGGVIQLLHEALPDQVVTTSEPILK